jgi:hypothetical protein
MNDRGAASRRLDVPRRRAKLASAHRREAAASRDAGAPAIAGYIADMTAQLESMATSSGLTLVSYFLAMARAESEAAARNEAAGERETAKSA